MPIRNLLLVTALTLICCVANSQQVETLYGPVPDQNVRVDQRLDNLVPQDAIFNDEHGNRVSIGEFFGTKPVVMTMIYYKCPLICSEVMSGLLAVARVLKFTAGKEYEIVLVSIDPKETPEIAMAKKSQFLRTYNRDGAENGWHFLTGEKQEIDKVADACGFKYQFDPKTGLYAHGAAIWITTPKGHISQYLKGVEFKERDLRLALMSASEERIGNLADQITLFCYMWDPATGKYGIAVLRLMQLGGILTILMLGGFIFSAIKKDKNKMLVKKNISELNDGEQS